MKKLIVSALLLVGFVSCNKEDIIKVNQPVQPEQIYNTKEGDGLDPLGLIPIVGTKEKKEAFCECCGYQLPTTLAAHTDHQPCGVVYRYP